MCWEMDYYWFAEPQKAQEKEQAKEREKHKAKQAQRTDAIDKLLSEANKRADTADDALPGRETVAAK